MRKALAIVTLILLSNLATLSFSGATPEDLDAKQAKEKWVEVDKISKIIEIPQLSSYYFQIKDSTIYENVLEKLPVLDALKRVPNWLRSDLEKNLLKMVDLKVDIGDNAAPALFDLDKDGDYDLVVGTREGKLLVHENKGYYWLKRCELNDSLGTPIDVGSYATLTFENLTGNSNPDLIIGSYEGTLRVYENTTSGWEFKGFIRDVNKNIIDVGTHSAPAFGWVIYDTDGEHRSDRRDLIIGCDDGTIWCYESTADLYENTMYNWKYRGMLIADGIAPTPIGIGIEGYSKPALADLTGDRLNDLIVGFDDGTVEFYRCKNTKEAEFYENTAVYERVNDEYSDDYNYSAPAVADLDKNPLLPWDLLNDTIVGWGDGSLHVYKNVGTVNTPRWDVWCKAPFEIPTENYFKERNLSVVRKYLDLILNAENKYVDEIAFSIAHTSPAVLTDENVYPEVFKRNAELIYEIAERIQYAELIEYGNYSEGDYGTTIRYDRYHLPRDIYYWYVVHPKITDEIPTFIDPETGAPSKYGYFWREYLFFYADESYPPDPETDVDGDGKPDFYYPKDAKPPLLKEKIANITILYDGKPYNAPSGYDDDGYLRDPDPEGNRRRSWAWSYEKNHAIELVSNWVAKTLPLNEQESRDGERPIQPVRIAHHHNGNCGELQDLTVAAARACLIPASGICLIGEDHVWSEFYYNDAWHQWDNYWSDSGSVIDNFYNYWVGWGRRGGSGIFRCNGDDSIEDVTSAYVPAAPLVKVVVNDKNGNPVDGALVVLSSYWLADHAVESMVGVSFGLVHYVSGAAIPSIWNFTDWNGVAEFHVVGDFSISVYSKLGRESKGPVTIKGVGDYSKGTTVGIDYGWISNETDEVVWKMGYGGPAGGDFRNRYNELAKYLDPGNYTVHYKTDREHAYSDWKAKPPSAGPWGIRVIPEEGDAVKIENVQNKKHEKRMFTIPGPNKTEVSIFCVGEWGNYYEFKLNDTVPYPTHNRGYDLARLFKDYHTDISYSLLYGEQDQKYAITTRLPGFPHTWGRFEHPVKVDSSIDCFITSATNAKKYFQGLRFDYNYTWSREDVYGASFGNINISDGDFIIFSNTESIESSKFLEVTITLYKHQIPFNLTLHTEEKPLELVVSGRAEHPSINRINIRLDYGEWVVANHWKPPDKNYYEWSYTINLTRNYLGEHQIAVRAVSSADIHAFNTTEVKFKNQLPIITIIAPEEKIINNTAAVVVNVSDEDSPGGEAQKVWVGLNGLWKVASKKDKNWAAELNTSLFQDGRYKLYVKVFDGIVYYVEAIRVIIDNTKPHLTILKPFEDETVSGVISIEGYAYDCNLVKNVYIKIDDLLEYKLTISWSEILYWDYTLHTTKFSEGLHTISVRAFDGRYNTTVMRNITVDNNKLPGILYSPVNDTIKIFENSTQKFKIIGAKDPEGRNLTKNWYLRKKQITGEFSEWEDITDQTLLNNSIYLFKADNDSSGSYQIKVVVSDTYDYGDNGDKLEGHESVTQIWSLTVENVNRVPQILAYASDKGGLKMGLTINELDSIRFEVRCKDLDNDTLFINWSVNNKLVDSAKAAYSTFTLANKSAGEYIIEVNVSDSCDYISLKWFVRMIKINHPPDAKFLPTEKYINITAPRSSLFEIINESDYDGDNLTIKWRLNGEIIREKLNSTYYEPEFREGGLWNVSVEIFDGEDSIFNYWLVNVYVEPIPSPPIFELGAIVCAILAAILIALSIKLLKKRL